MAELSGKSAGVSTREIDLSGPTPIKPRGIPAGIIGTSVRGPAFVPVTFATYQDFAVEFGDTDGEKFGPLAVNEWMKNAAAGTFIKLLGVGDGRQRDTTDGAVRNAGFTVGQQIPQATGLIGANTKTEDAIGGTGVLGRTHFLGCFMSQSAGSTIFSDAGITEVGTTGSHPIIRGVLFTASGVVASLSASQVSNNTPITCSAYPPAGGDAGFGPFKNAGAQLGDVITGSSKQDFVMILNGHKISNTSTNALTASFDPTSTSYFSKIFNTDPLKIEEHGHYLYAHYDIHPVLAVITGTDIGKVISGSLPLGNNMKSTLGFMLTGSMNRASSAAASATNVGVPDFESFTDRFTTAKSPFVISQAFGGSNNNLFRVHARDDGANGQTVFKITIENVQASSNEKNKFGKFDLLVREFDDSDLNPKVLESFRGLDVNPSSDRYVARVIGDYNSYYDFDRKPGSQKLVTEGKYPNSSQYIRIEESDDLRLGRLDDTALPAGFRGLAHLVTSGSATNGAAAQNILTGSYIPGAGGGTNRTVGITTEELARCVQPPVPFRENIGVGASPKARVENSLTWGVQFEKKDLIAELNRNQAVDTSLYSFVKYFPDFHLSKQNPQVGANEGTADLAGCVLDADRFNNNLFTLERIQVITGSDNRPDPMQWQAAKYRRNGTATSVLMNRDNIETNFTRFLDAGTDFKHLPSRKYLKFTFPIQGGSDGLNIFDKNKTKMTDTAVRREMDDTSGESNAESATVASVRKAIDVMEERSDVDIQLLSLPGFRHEAITDYAIDAVERRFDALLIMDIEEKDTVDTFVTSSADQPINVGNTVNRFSGRALDSSFAAAYFPDVVIMDPSTQTNVQCPPSVAVLGALSLNDAVAHPWFAPAGFTRGALKSVIESQVKLNRNNLDDLYVADINPITAFAHSPGVVVFGQKTLLAASSALDRVNVRRLLIEIRRKVRNVANRLLFEPNREDTLARFTASVTPMLTQIQQQQGLDRFKVQIDTTTTTQADVENNTIRGKIFLQPTRTVEFISLDFVVTNAGSGV